MNDYSALLQAEKEAEKVIQVANSSYYQGEYRKAIQLYEQALSVFERTENDSLRADIVFRIAHIYKELQELTANSLVLKLLPQRSDPLPVIEAVNHMLLALVAEAEQNWGIAIKAWNTALDYTEADSELQLICQGAVIGLDVKNWLNNPDTTTRESLLTRLDEWQEACRIKQQFASLCHAYLLQARIAFTLVQFEKMERLLERSLEIANEHNLKIYLELIYKEKDLFLQHRDQISALLEAERAVSPEEKMKILQDYMKTALEIVDSQKKEK